MSTITLGRRVQRSNGFFDSWEDVSAISKDEVCVVCLGGDGVQDTKASNGAVKAFQEELDVVLGGVVPVYGVVYDFVRADQDKARKEEFVRYGMLNSVSEKRKISMMNNGKKPDVDYVFDIYKKIVEPRISIQDGSKKIDPEQAAINLRKVTFMAHCHGAFVALKLEEFMSKKMTELKYSVREKEFILRQMLVVAQAPAAPLGVAHSTFVSFLSAVDVCTSKPINYLSLYIQQKIKEDMNYVHAKANNDRFGENVGQPFELKPCFLRGRMGNCFLVKQKYPYNFQPGAKLIDFKEHEFIGFDDHELTDEGWLLQKLVRNTLINGVKNSLKQREKLLPLPDIERLVCVNEKERDVLRQMKKNGDYLIRQACAWGRQLAQIRVGCFKS